MKAEILQAAVQLMTQNGQTSTLEVKNHIHSQKNDPMFVLTQREVSGIMRTLAQEENWNTRFNGSYIVYSPSAFTNPNPTGSLSTAIGMHALNATTTGSNSGPFGTGANLSSPGLIHKNPNDHMVAYIRSNDKFYVTGSDKNDVRRKLYALANNAFNLDITYDDINYCTQEYYNKHHA